jgi:hypothetical protein
MLPSARFSAQCLPPPSSGNTERLLTVGVLSSFFGLFKNNSCEVVFGGAGLGTAAGYFAHIARSASGDVPSTPVVPPVTSDSES